MKKGVVIGASEESEYVICTAKQLGIEVIALDGNPNAKGFLYSDDSVVVDIKNKELVSKIIQEIKPDFILPVPIGRHLSTVGYINGKFGLKGIKFTPVKNSVDKLLFHEILNKAGLRPINAYLVNKYDYSQAFNINYPAIVKPRYGSGSRDIYWINSKKDVLKCIENIVKSQEDYIIEEAFSGEEYGLDAAIIESRLYLILLRKKINTPLPFRQAVSYISIEKENVLYKKVNTIMEKVFQILQYDNCLVHADLIINKEGVFVIEAAPRPSGHNLYSVFVPVVTGIDMAKEYISFLMGRKADFTVKNIIKAQIHFFDFENKRVVNIPKESYLKSALGDSLLVWRCNMEQGQFLENITDGHSIINRGFFIICGNSEKELFKKSQWIMEQFETINC